MAPHHILKRIPVETLEKADRDGEKADFADSEPILENLASAELPAITPARGEKRIQPTPHPTLSRVFPLAEPLAEPLEENTEVRA